MRFNHHHLVRPFVVAASAAMIARMLALVFGPWVGLAADHQDNSGNVSEDNKPFEETTGCPEWVSSVKGFSNVAPGAGMMCVLTTGSDNVALDFGAHGLLKGG